MKTPIVYYGGKQTMLPHILPLIPSHTVYCEPFVGGGAVFFAKPPTYVEAINDKDGRVVNFYKVLQTKFDELKLMLDCTLHSERQYKEAGKILKKGGSDVEMAWALWVQTNMSFGCGIGKGFCFSNKDSQPQLTKNKILRFKKLLSDRLKNVEIFERDAIDLIKLKDSKNTFFYIDPPYVSANQGHYKGYAEKNFIDLLDTLKSIKGKFLLSSYLEPSLIEAREKNRWQSIDIKKSLTMKLRVKGKSKVECLTFNYSINTQKTLF